jgi:ankyrin repeat protein
MGHSNAAIVLLEAGARPDAVDADGVSVVEWAVRQGDGRLLLRLSEVDTARPTRRQLDVAACVAAAGSTAVALAALLDLGVSADVACTDGGSLLTHAALDGEIGVVAALLDAAASIDRTTRSGNTALHLACHMGRVDVAARLLDAGADPDSRGEARRTPLMMAAREGHEAVASLLVSRGANARLRDAEGHSARVIAERAGHDSLVAELDRLRASSPGLFGLF